MKPSPVDAAAMLEALVDLIADRVALKLSPANTVTPWAPLADVAARLGWTPRHLRAFCAQHGLAPAAPSNVTDGGTR